MIKKADIIVSIIMLLLSLAAAAAISLSGKDAAFAVVTVAGEHIMSINMETDGEYEISDGGFRNTLLVENGSIRMIKADCPGGTCIKTGSIGKTNQSIACLPNKVFVSIVSEEAEVDSVVR